MRTDEAEIPDRNGRLTAGGKETAERASRPLQVWMRGVESAQSNDFSIRQNGGLGIILAVLLEKTFHEPGFCVARIDLENSIEENLCDLPSFVRNGAGGVTAIKPDHVLGWFRARSPSAVGFSNHFDH
jgi:hypothetical protein